MIHDACYYLQVLPVYHSFGIVWPISEKLPQIIAGKSRSSPLHSLQLLRTHAVAIATVLFACFPVAQSSKPLPTLAINVRRDFGEL